MRTQPDRRSSSDAGRSPSRRLILGLCLCLFTVFGFGVYAVHQIRDLRDRQTAIAERNRKDSLQLLRIQNNLFTLATAMRDMVEQTEPYPMSAWRNTFERIRLDLAHAIALEQTLAPAARPAAQQERLLAATQRFWDLVDQVFGLAEQGHDEQAAHIVRTGLTTQHMELVGLVSQFLVLNNLVEEEAAELNRAIYGRVEREILFLVAGLLVVVGVGGAYIIAANRRAFEDVRRLSGQLRELSWRVMRMQEDVQHALSRELHDEFGQIATAIGTLLGRVRRNLPADSPLAADLEQVRAIAQETLDRIRTQSRLLHPVILDDFGLENALRWYAEQYGRQSGLEIDYVQSGSIGFIPEDVAIHLYRIAQEALTNVKQHSGSSRATVRLRQQEDWLELEVEDRGRGLAAAPGRDAASGIGLISMRERTELMGGEFALRPAPAGGLIVLVRVPLEAATAAARVPA
jgi:signal transduction histidine kinase